MAAVLDLSQPPMSGDHRHHLLLLPPMSHEAAGPDEVPFEISHYLNVDDGPQWEGEESSLGAVDVEQELLFAGLESGGFDWQQTGDGLNDCEHVEKRTKVAEHGKRVGFRTKSVVEILDDGYKWRKYGKKSVKNSPNPRNYFKCNTQGCTVKKRVERDREDPSYVLTIYEGKHNHICPTALHYSNYSSATAGSIIPVWSSNAIQSYP